MSFITQSIDERSKLKKKCKLQSLNSFSKHSSFTSKQSPKIILGRMFQIDYSKQIKPQQIKPNQVQTYGAMTQNQLKSIFHKLISREMLKRIIMDTMKLCYLFTPIMQAIEAEIESTREEYKVKDVLRILVGGSFYQFLTMKTQPTKFLFNNRTTQINVKTIISAILIIVANKLTIKSLSDVVLYYRLQEALYQTAPHGLPFEFQKIIKAIKKVDRNITAEKFAKWEKRMLSLQIDAKFLEPYHFLYLMSLSEPMAKKKPNIVEIERRQSKIQKHSQLMSLMKDKNNFINAETHKTNWKNNIKVRGLSFRQKSQTLHISSVNSEFVDLRKRIISHKRIKSAVITRKAVEMVEKDLVKNNQKQNTNFLKKQYFSPKQPQKQRKLLKKHNKLWVELKEFEETKKLQHKKFTTVYEKQFKKHNLDKSQNEQNHDNKQQSHQIQQDSRWVVKDDEEIVDIYSHPSPDKNFSQCQKSLIQQKSQSIKSITGEGKYAQMALKYNCNFYNQDTIQYNE